MQALITHLPESALPEVQTPFSNQNGAASILSVIFAFLFPLAFLEHMCYNGFMFKFAKAVEKYKYPEPEVITWDLPIKEIQRVIRSYARLMHCSYDEAIGQLCYMSYRDAKDFLGER